MRIEEPSDIQALIKELRQAANRMDRDRYGAPLKERQANALIFSGLYTLVVVLFVVLWEKGLF